MKKTQAIRMLDQQRIAYNLMTYTYNPEDLDVKKIARENNLDIRSIYKTLVLKGDRTGLLVAVIGGDQRLNLKAIAKLSNNKKVQLLPMAQLEEHTGYIRGACSPIGMKKSFPVHIDESAKELNKIWVNAGMRGLLMQLEVKDLVQLCSANLVAIGEKEVIEKGRL